MRSAVISRIAKLFRIAEGSYGFEYAVLSAAVACALVLAASVFSSETLRLIHELRCDLSPACAVQFESRLRPAVTPAAEVSTTAVASGTAPAAAGIPYIVVSPLQESEKP